MAAIEELVKAGKKRFVGVSNFSGKEVARGAASLQGFVVSGELQ
jgi:diketogulonate reductase-like aldo/keto reductase